MVNDIPFCDRVKFTSKEWMEQSMSALDFKVVPVLSVYTCTTPKKDLGEPLFLIFQKDVLFVNEMSFRRICRTQY